jgi:hypothetical protein
MTIMVTRVTLLLLTLFTTSVQAHDGPEYFSPSSVRAASRACVYNATHCACVATKNENAGVCLRHISGAGNAARCIGDSCSKNGFKCDCLGTDLCEMKSCGSWKAIGSGTTALGAKNVPCKLAKSGSCLTKIGPLPAKVAEAPKEYKMVQLGPRIKALLFNMTYQTDKNDAMVKAFKNGDGVSMHDTWPDKDSLKQRQLNIRLYQSQDSSTRFVCTIINSWGGENDGLGNYRVTSTITGRNQQTLNFMQCDDWTGSTRSGECNAPYSGTELTANHVGMVIHTDGWCVGPLEANGNTIGIKFDGVENMNGLNFLGSDGEASEYSFLDSTVGLTGTVDGNGLVHNGSVPLILIKPSGIEIP